MGAVAEVPAFTVSVEVVREVAGMAATRQMGMPELPIQAAVGVLDRLTMLLQLEAVVPVVPAS